MILPIGKYKKSEVREIAEKNNLPTAKKPDSQGLCFIGDVDLKSFLKNKLNLEKGNVLDLNGKVIGFHDGAAIYTVGERHGFHVETQNTNQEPLYIISKDIDKNTLTVGKKEDMKITNVNEVEIKYLNLLVDDLPENFEVAFRYQGKTENVIVKSKKENLLIIKTENEILKPASGQSAVFYKEGCCLGGGVIQ